MALVLANRVQETATPNTTASFTLSGAVPGFQSFAVIGDTNTTYYAATDVTGNWEVGLAMYFTAGPTLDRIAVYASSNSNNPVTFSGPVNVFVTYPSGRSVNLDGSGNVSALGTISSGAWQGSTIGVAYGGTGVTSSSGPNSVMIRDSSQNVTVNRLNQSNTETLATGGSTLLTTASSYLQTLVGGGGHTYLLPDATTLTTGVAFVFNNMSTGNLTIQNYATGSVGTIPAGGAGAVFLVFNGTVGGFWEVHSYLPEGVTFGTNAFNLGTSVISGGTWQGGTIQPAYGGTGLTTFAGPNNALYSTSFDTLTAGTLPVAAGGTGLSSYTLNGVVYASTTTTLATSAALSFDGTSLYIGNNAYYNVKNAGNIDVQMLGISPTNIAYVGPSSFGAISAIVNASASVAFTEFHASGLEVMRLNSTGLSIGITSSPYWVSSPGVGGPVRLVASNTDTNTAGFYYVSNDAIGPKIYLGKARGTGTTAVSFGDELGSVFFNGYDGSFLRPAARIEVEVDGSVASDQMPGRLLFLTSPTSGSANPFERMRIDSAGNVGIGTNTATAVSSILHVRSADPVLTIQDTETGFANTYAKIVTTGTGVGGGPRTDVQWMFGSTGNSFTFNYGTSSTERLRIDSAGNVGIGTSSPATNLVVQTTGNTEVRISTSNNAVGQTNTLRFSSTALGGAYAGGGAYIQSIQGSGVDIYDLAFGTALNSTAATERMRLDSAGNLGIGTSSPNGRLTLSGYSSANQTPDIQITRSSSGTAIQTGPNITFGDGTTNNTTTLQVTQGRFGVWNYGAGVWNERMSIDASGNLGLGVTPSAWASGWRALQTVGGNSFYSDSSVSALASNAIYDGAWKYVNTAGAGTYQINRNAHNWFNAPSGTAGTAITFTTAMTLNASGNLGLGATIPAWNTGGNIVLSNTRYLSSTGSVIGVVANGYFDTTDSRWEYASTAAASWYSQNAGQHQWFNAPSGTVNTAITFTQAMTLDTNGRLLVGLTASNSGFAGKLQVEGTSDAFASLVRYSSGVNNGPVFYFGRSKSATLGTNTIVAADDVLGTIAFSGANGTNYRDAAYIQGFVDGTPGGGSDMPGRLVFSTSPDGTATPSERMRITSVGQVILNSGFTRTNFAGNTTTPLLQIEGTTAATASTSIVRGAADAIGPTFNLGKTRGLVSGNTIVASGDQLGIINFQGADGANLLAAASIQAVVDGTPGSVDMPGRLVFSTAADNASFPTERARIDSAGNVQVLTGANVVWAPEPAAINTTATLTNANIQAQIISTTGTSYTVTMPLGTTLETLVTWAAVNLGYDFTVINTASGTITMAVNTGVTSLGALTIATGTSAQFRIRRTAANTFVLYRMF